MPSYDADTERISAYVPRGIELEDDCPVRALAYFFVDILSFKRIFLPKKKAHLPFILSYRRLRCVIPEWKDVWAVLKDRYVVRDKHKKGVRSCGYRIAPEFREQPCTVRVFRQRRLFKRWEARNKAFPLGTTETHLYDQLRRLTLDIERFDEVISPDHEYNTLCRRRAETISDGYFRLNTDRFSGRVHSNVTNLPSELRPLLRVDGQTLCEMDIANSQPLFLAMAAKAAGAEDSLYVKLCEEGGLYQFIGRKLGVSRKNAKGRAFRAIFSSNRKDSKTKRLFREFFPNTAAYMHDTKADNYKLLAKAMQTAERRFVIDTVCERLRKLNPEMFLTTIHDSILSKPADAEIVESIMRDEFEKRGFSPKINTKML